MALWTWSLAIASVDSEANKTTDNENIRVHQNTSLIHAAEEVRYVLILAEKGIG